MNLSDNKWGVVVERPGVAHEEASHAKVHGGDETLQLVACPPNSLCIEHRCTCRLGYLRHFNHHLDDGFKCILYRCKSSSDCVQRTFPNTHYTAALGLNLKSFIISKIVIIFDLNFPFRARSAAASIAATGPSMAAQTSAGKELAHCSTVFRSGQIIEVAPVDWKKGINKEKFFSTYHIADNFIPETGIFIMADGHIQVPHALLIVKGHQRWRPFPSCGSTLTPAVISRQLFAWNRTSASWVLFTSRRDHILSAKAAARGQAIVSRLAPLMNSAQRQASPPRRYRSKMFASASSLKAAIGSAVYISCHCWPYLMRSRYQGEEARAL
ncbi:hypothetical protein TYRP_014861 [Tyrophagus putrescentiae]|nr:hypothetical protein TYRP_014861 [Tyrophagus putrescentiae]